MSGEATDETVLRPCDIEPRSPLRRRRESSEQTGKSSATRVDDVANLPLLGVSRRWDDRRMSTRAHRREGPISLASRDETLPLLKAASTRMDPGEVLVACLDRHRRLIELIPVAAGDDELPALAETLARAPKNVRAVVVATVRRNVAPAEPEDEPRWEAMQAALARSHVTLLDWFVICGPRWAWSVAEHADTPAQW
jgi:hypothetical protein